jgi:hypothetical protein
MVVVEITSECGEVERYLLAGNILEIVAKDPIYERLAGAVKDYEFLGNLSEDALFEKCGEALGGDHRSDPFLDFTQEHRDTYLRMKLRHLRNQFAKP